MWSRFMYKDKSMTALIFRMFDLFQGLEWGYKHGSEVHFSCWDVIFNQDTMFCDQLTE